MRTARAEPHQIGSITLLVTYVCSSHKLGHFKWKMKTTPPPNLDDQKIAGSTCAWIHHCFSGEGATNNFSFYFVQDCRFVQTIAGEPRSTWSGFQLASTGQNCERNIFTNENIVQHRTSGCKWTWPITGNSKGRYSHRGVTRGLTLLIHYARPERVLVYVMLLSPGRDAWSNLPLAYLHSDMKKIVKTEDAF